MNEGWPAGEEAWEDSHWGSVPPSRRRIPRARLAPPGRRGRLLRDRPTSAVRPGGCCRAQRLGGLRPPASDRPAALWHESGAGLGHLPWRPRDVQALATPARTPPQAHRAPRWGARR